MTTYAKAMQLRTKIMHHLLEEIRFIKNLEDDGNTLDDKPYTRGVAWWWYSDIGYQRVTAMHNQSKPIYPEGDWFLVAITLDGNITDDNTIAAARNILEVEENNPQEKHTL